MAEEASRGERERAFEALAAEAQACGRCPRLAERVAVLSRANGSLTPRVVFVAEAPGRRGGDRTRVPMQGDASGRHFRWLMEQAELRLEDVFITNAALCNPRTATGANDKPTAAEIANCSGFLRRQLDLLRPELVVSVGATALDALNRLEPHGLRLAEDVGRCVAWRGTRLIPVYHPSPQVVISRRSLAEQAADWQAIRRALDGKREGVNASRA
ncbi:MAG TPA: uracil-DNA glycosylase [Chthonomonadaceae bacterium]|nr:uracil-DNA glycosylase [Chthonomonadaceae bacterium]